MDMASHLMWYAKPRHNTGLAGWTDTRHSCFWRFCNSPARFFAKYLVICSTNSENRISGIQIHSGAKSGTVSGTEMLRLEDRMVRSALSDYPSVSFVPDWTVSGKTNKTTAEDLGLGNPVSRGRWCPTMPHHTVYRPAAETGLIPNRP